MSRNIRIILSLSIIFVLGVITGVSITPIIVQDVAGNPHSIYVLGERVYNTNILKDIGIADSQKYDSDELITKYVLKYTAERDLFISKRQTLYDEFKQELSTILTPVQFSEYEARSEAAMVERSMYNKRMEALWRQEREILKQKRNQNRIDNSEKVVDNSEKISVLEQAPSIQ